MKQPRAFTLIELLIVVGIISLFSGAVHAVIVRLMTVHQTFDRHMMVQARGDEALETWRKDVTLAGSVSLAPDGRGATIQQGERRIEYTFAGGKLVRRETGAADRVLVERVIASAVEPVDGVWRLSFATEDSDGVTKWKQSFAGIATPLIPVVEVKP